MLPLCYAAPPPTSSSFVLDEGDSLATTISVDSLTKCLHPQLSTSSTN